MLLEGVLGVEAVEEDRGRRHGHAWEAEGSLPGLLDEPARSSAGLFLCLGRHWVGTVEDRGEVVLVEVRRWDGHAGDGGGWMRRGGRRGSGIGRRRGRRGGRRRRLTQLRHDDVKTLLCVVPNDEEAGG